ncbi:MAG: RNA polymerase sigma-70 factor [Anaerolineales bacterium]|nr:RNA polymerase sigma-70 factor [Anaerolineales bacterium]
MMLDHTTLFQTHRPHLFAIAYRMLGTVMDAEDLVQESYLRWQKLDLLEIETPKAFLTTLITRLCIDFLRSARVQRESYIGPWLPEPILSERLPGVDDDVARRESVSVAFLFLLEQLKPVERAAFLLREVFDYDYAEIADILDKAPANCRQIVSRARRQLSGSQPSWRLDRPVPDQAHLTLLEQFVNACATADLPALRSLLQEDVVLWSDGGGKAMAARKPIHGATPVARFLLNLPRFAPADFAFRLSHVNGRPALLLYDGQRPISVITFAVLAGKISQFQNILNPDKLGQIPALAAL